MKIAICDDEPDSIKQISYYLMQYDAVAEWDGFTSSREFLEAFRLKPYDIVFLDINMYKPNGYQVARELSKYENRPITIFVTQSSDYAIKGYEVAFRYLQKPINYGDFERAILAAYEEATPKTLSFLSEGKTVILSVHSIMYFESFNYIIKVHTTNDKLQVRITLKELEHTLIGSYFVRTHNSYLVNIEYIQSIDHKELLLLNGERIPISRGRKCELEQRICDYIRR